MNTEIATTVDHGALRCLFDAAVAEIQPTRRANLTNDFYGQIGDAIFNAGCLALNDAATDTRRMLTVSAPAGSGKTSFSYALAIAVTRYAKSHPGAPYGVALLVNRRDTADTVYRELEALLPGQVAVWTTDHDKANPKGERVKNPAALFHREDLQNYAVAIVTHEFYLDTNGHLARTVVHDGTTHQRTLTIVDELPNEVSSVAISLSQAEAIRGPLVEAHPEIKPHMDALFKLMEPCNYDPANTLYRANKEWTDLQRDLAWFQSKTALCIATDEHGRALLDFARGLLVGRSWGRMDGIEPEFYAYRDHRIIDRTAGVILFDASADIDGRSNIVPWREEIRTPQASYDNLEIVLIPQHTKERLTKYLEKAANQRAYVQWMTETIHQYMQAEEKGLVVCKKKLFDEERIPTWPVGDERFKDPDNFTQRYEWNLEDRSLCAIHYGTGIGDNFWSDAAVVFLFDEHILPKAAAISQAQVLRAERTDQGELGVMKTFMNKPPGVTSLSEGERLRWTKQLALRGNARNYDEHGVCGKQRLVIACDPKLFLANAGRLFPGAPVKMVQGATGSTTVQAQILAFLSNTTQKIVTQKDISQAVEKPWRAIAHYVKRAGFMSSIASLGWTYVNRKGRLGSYFERLLPNKEPNAVLSAFM
jgi:hypothetical protein